MDTDKYTNKLWMDILFPIWERRIMFAIKTENLSKVYPNQTALTSLNLSVKKGDL